MATVLRVLRSTGRAQSRAQFANCITNSFTFGSSHSSLALLFCHLINSFTFAVLTTELLIVVCECEWGIQIERSLQSCLCQNTIKLQTERWPQCNCDQYNPLYVCNWSPRSNWNNSWITISKCCDVKSSNVRNEFAVPYVRFHRKLIAEQEMQNFDISQWYVTFITQTTPNLQCICFHFEQQ